MRIAIGVSAILAVAACADGGARSVSAPERATSKVLQPRSIAGGIPASGQGLGGPPVGGEGTLNFLAAWTGPASLGNAPAKIDENGNLVLRPGSAIIVLSADGTKCFRIDGEAITKLTPNCPTF